MARPEALLDFPDISSSSDRCPDCGTSRLDKLGRARACGICGYYRAPPAPDAHILGILGRGSYQRLRARLRYMIRRLTVGEVVGQVNSREIVNALANDLGVNHGTVLEHQKVIDEATHLIFLGEFANEYRGRVLAQGKPLRTIVLGRWLAPPGGWPKRPPQPKEDWPALDGLNLDPADNPFGSEPRNWTFGDAGNI